MKSSSFYSDIIRSIEELYSSVTMRILQKRRDAYHSETGNTGNGGSLDIKAPLFKYIDNVSPQKQEDTSKNKPANKPHASGTAHPNPSAHLEILNKDIGSGLTSHFKARTNARLHPGLAEKLERSIWEHIHQSISHAKRGEADLAKMHADIASNAYKELAHYVSPEAQNELASRIEEELEGLSKLK